MTLSSDEHINQLCTTIGKNSIYGLYWNIICICWAEYKRYGCYCDCKRNRPTTIRQVIDQEIYRNWLDRDACTQSTKAGTTPLSTLLGKVFILNAWKQHGRAREIPFQTDLIHQRFYWVRMSQTRYSGSICFLLISESRFEQLIAWQVTGVYVIEILFVFQLQIINSKQLVEMCRIHILSFRAFLQRL